VLAIAKVRFDPSWSNYEGVNSNHEAEVKPASPHVGRKHGQLWVVLEFIGWASAGFVPHLYILVPWLEALPRQPDPVASGIGYYVYAEVVILPATVLMMIALLLFRRVNWSMYVLVGSIIGLLAVLQVGSRFDG
jgi:hypothetical protein